jgi:hypothetical protein
VEGHFCDIQNCRGLFAKRQRKDSVDQGLGRSRSFITDRAVDATVDRVVDPVNGCTVHRSLKAKGYTIRAVDLGSGGPGGLQAGTRRWTATHDRLAAAPGGKLVGASPEKAFSS